MQKYYRYKYYLNASHSFDGNHEQKHTHTFAITLCIEIDQNAFVSFVSVDKRLEAYFGCFNKKYLNEVKEFCHLEPTIENMGDLFYEELRLQLEQVGMRLLQLEIMETPVRCYSVSDRLLLASKPSTDSQRRWEGILQKTIYLHTL